MLKFNEHILLVIKWLQNKDSVSEEELRLNGNAAVDVAEAAAVAANARAANAAVAAFDAAVLSDIAMGANFRLRRTEERLNEYFELTKEDRGKYEERIKYLNVLGVNNEKV